MKFERKMAYVEDLCDKMQIKLHDWQKTVIARAIRPSKVKSFEIFKKKVEKAKHEQTGV